MGDVEGAREILQEVLHEGDDEQKTEAQDAAVQARLRSASQGRNGGSACRRFFAAAWRFARCRSGDDNGA